MYKHLVLDELFRALALLVDKLKDNNTNTDYLYEVINGIKVLSDKIRTIALEAPKEVIK